MLFGRCGSGFVLFNGVYLEKVFIGDVAVSDVFYAVRAKCAGADRKLAEQGILYVLATKGVGFFILYSCKRQVFHSNRIFAPGSTCVKVVSFCGHS